MSSNQFLNLYAEFLRKFLKPQKPLKIVFDCSNGTAGLVLGEIEEFIPNSNFIILNSEPDGNFPAHGPNPSKPGATKQLQTAVKKNKADLGIIFDGDADRMLCVDDKGRFVDPEIITRLLIWHLKPEKTIIDSITGWLVKNYQLPVASYQLLVSKVGQYFIKQKMRAENADFGAERSGHYYFKEFFGLDSGILAAIETINAVSNLPYQLSDFVDLLPQYYREEIDFDISHIHDKENLFKKIEESYLIPNTKYLIQANHLDGLTIEFSDYWFNIRFSQTEPLIRLNVEAATKAKLQEEISKLRRLLS